MKNKQEDLKTIKILLTVIIALLTINTCFAIFSSGKDSSNNNTDNGTNTTETEEYDVSSFKKLNESEFMTSINSSDAQVYYFGRATCGYCVKFLPILKQAQTELKYTTNYVDITAIDTSSSDYTKMEELINAKTDDFNEKYGMTGDDAYEYLFGYTPLIVVAKKGKIVDVWVGYSEYDQFVSWLNEAGIK